MTGFDWGMLNSASFLFCVILLIALVMLVTAAIIAALTVRNMRRSQRQTATVQAEWQAERFDEDGQPLPPFARGLCDVCHKAFDKVYYLPSGRRLCPACYTTVDANPGAPTDASHRPD
jgi:hypothetical protein